jgi:hypothetical protein
LLVLINLLFFGGVSTGRADYWRLVSRVARRVRGFVSVTGSEARKTIALPFFYPSPRSMEFERLRSCAPAAAIVAQKTIRQIQASSSAPLFEFLVV